VTTQTLREDSRLTPAGGFTAENALRLIALLPEAVVLGALLRLAGATDSAGLWRSSFGRYVSIMLLMVLGPFLSKDLGDAALVMVGLLVLGAVVGALVFRVWFGVALIRLRHRLGGLAAVIGWLELLAAASWLVFRVLLIASDDRIALDRVDMLRSLVATVACDLLLALLFLGLRDRLAGAPPA
jgi:hypothetical protein